VRFDALVQNLDELGDNLIALLTSIVGLSSIASTILFGAILVQATGGLVVQSLVLRLVIAAGAFYMVLQISIALLAAMRGLGRRGYETLGFEDVIRHGDEARSFYLRRRAIKCLQVYWQHEQQNNAKVTHLAVAHQAMKNFIGGLLVLALVCLPFAVGEHHESLVERLKSDHELRELLRGPQGPPGPVGPRGEAATNAPARSPSSNQARQPSRKGRDNRHQVHQ
jgi:hypothetical protein